MGNRQPAKRMVASDPAAHTYVKRAGGDSEIVATYLGATGYEIEVPDASPQLIPAADFDAVWQRAGKAKLVDSASTPEG